MGLLWAVWGLKRVPGFWWTLFRVLAWPPSRKRYDKARLGL